MFKYIIILDLRSGVIVTESLLEAISQYINLESIQDTNFKQWLTTVSITSPGHVVKAPNGLINTLNKISAYGPIGIL